MTNVPVKITAWANRDGTTEFSSDKLFPKGIEEEYIHTTAITQVVNALRELKTCVEDGCYCSEMRLAAAVDDANAALKLIGPTQ